MRELRHTAQCSCGHGILLRAPTDAERSKISRGCVWACCLMVLECQACRVSFLVHEEALDERRDD